MTSSSISLFPRRPTLLLVSAIPAMVLAAACGGSSELGSGTAPGQSPSETSAAGSASFTLVSDRPSAASLSGASFTLGASFTVAPPACEKTTLGACTVNPCYAPPSSVQGVTMPNVGEVDLASPAGPALALVPQADGTYSSQSVEGELPWSAGRQSLTFTWAHPPGESTGPGDSIQIPTPPYIALTAASAFATSPFTVDRAQDLTVAWTSDTSAAPTDEVAVSLITGSTQVDCIFGAAAGTAVVPAAALAALGAGVGNYNVHSKDYASKAVVGGGTGETAGTWSLDFNVDAYARTSYGLANGPVTIQ
jgi:hypothetical protein